MTRDMAEYPTRVYGGEECVRGAVRSQEVISQARVRHAKLERRQQKLARNEPQFCENGKHAVTRS